MIIGLIGCFIPIIPGPPLCYISLLVLNFFSSYQIENQFLIDWALIIVAITILDIWLQIYGVKKFGGKKMAINGTMIGLIVGLIVPIPFGFIIGPFVGAFLGAYLESEDKEFVKILKIAFGSIVGFLGGIVLKLVVCSYMIVELFKLF
jgi:uncharacterized protein YqgC (DUF456 family)